ncbi:MAG: FKBP-type peptidyl-prolyl cis-trans isomerase [bacterium]|nr:FKBP-type peptidyl-prolyl cis-trans isomerase [bacterium]
MNPIQKNIAVALALIVVALFFIFPGASFFGGQASADITNQTASAVQTTMPTEPVTELLIKDDVVGGGATASAGDSVTVNYVGALTSGTVFDASASHPETASGFTFNLGAGQVIKGWDQGIVGMREGGKRTLVIPAALAYGSQEVGGVIPANSDLVFQVELLKVEKSAR